MDAMNERASGGSPPWHAAATMAPPDPDTELLAAIVATVREVRTLDATIAAADAELARLPTLLAWLVRVQHPVMWLICVPRHAAAAALTLPARAAPATLTLPARAAGARDGRRRRVALLAAALLAAALLAAALLAAVGMDVFGEVVR